MGDEQRALELGMTLDEFQSLVGHDPLVQHPEFLQNQQDKKENKEDKQ